jgi:hypothetical protein
MTYFRKILKDKISRKSGALQCAGSIIGTSVFTEGSQRDVQRRAHSATSPTSLTDEVI